MKHSIYVLFCFISLISLHAQNKITYQKVEARQNALDPKWVAYDAKTIDKLPGFKTKKPELTSIYGGFKVWKKEATGFFRTEKVDNRWWIIDPEGYPFIYKGIAVFNAGRSVNQQKAFDKKYGSNENWVKQESKLLRDNGFNGVGAWSNVNLIRNAENPLVYTVIISPMAMYHSDHIKKYGGKYKEASWQNYRFDLVMVFDKEFDSYIQKAVKEVSQYKNDKYLMGYFTDNELPWYNDALDKHLTLLAKDEQGYLAAKEWFDQRKGFNASVSDITQEDRMAFTAFYFETYMKKVTEALKKEDPNHMYLGCRFNQDKEQELTNPEIFKVAGIYMDIISINHYRKWEPNQELMNNWGEWSGKPFLITEWYTKGEDSGLPNNTGAGWLVRTQKERGLFYQNFTLALLKNKNSVGWHWFKYMDNDPQDLSTDYSNRDSNKGIVNSNFEPYQPLLKEMKVINDNAYELTRYFDKKN
ncbi:hypothetical protein J0383_05120 [Flavobacterium endoglycinae]|uniref:Agarase n=1 Tax=Flavobacterium endoglycinae TaxID=2816357 RepID=A0ABX7QGJ0_9FLAO|nr:hypothetical protein [Flavobacterium endoglycinae]QSW90200.1 hypothetical protein J0383_05120 [Flavobacterium endoglycinae]